MDTSFVYDIIDSLINQVVENRDPDSRAGASLALGCINSYVGGMVAGPRLRKVVGVLHSLANDPHPLVHKWVTRRSFFEFIILLGPSCIMANGGWCRTSVRSSREHNTQLNRQIVLI